MVVSLNENAQQDLTDRGFSRRNFGKIAALLSAAAASPTAFIGTASAQQQAARAIKGGTIIGANECWVGPFAPGVEAIAKYAVDGNRYDPDDLHDKLLSTIAMKEGVAESNVRVWPGSGGPLVSIVAAYCSPTKGLVTVNPTFESAWRTAAYLGAPLAMAPQAIGKGADVKGMLAANPNAGLYYVCTPNNPTGTVTPLADIQWLLDNKPAGSMVLVDEAYIHFSEAPSAIKLLGTRKDLIVMRTFSKLFGMAGIRLGITFADPEVQKKLALYNAVGGGISITAMACGAAVYNQDAMIKARRAEMTANREETIAWMTKKGIEVQGGSHANMFMVDWKKPAKDMQLALLSEKVQIGRAWAIWPTTSRITVGSGKDMAMFRAAVEKTYKA